MIKRILSLMALAALTCSCFLVGGGSQQGSSDQDGQEQGQVQTFLGGEAATPKPSKAADGPLEMPALTSEDELIRHDGYVISYNSDNRIPNWVAYELTADEAHGDEERGDRMFSMDPKYKKKQAMREDYRDSGWTKGHMAPAADFRWDEDAMDETFYLTNVCPQNEFLNANDWEYLERQVRYWAGKFGKVWVVTGPVVGDNRYGTIGDNDVVVPDSFFKAVLACKDGKYRSIAFLMNNDSQRYYLADCSMSVDELEEYTGLDFFPALDDSVEESVEAQYRPGDWGIRN